jgi:predicted Abi (CAAX) family protease
MKGKIHFLQGKVLAGGSRRGQQPSNYQGFEANPLVRYDSYPLQQRPDPNRYVPIGDWIGRLILPDQTQRFGGVFYEIHHAPAAHWSLVGQVVQLGWTSQPTVQRLVQAVTGDVHFTAEVEQSQLYSGAIHPTRLNHWSLVDPLESLAGSLPTDSLIAMVENPQLIQDDQGITLRIASQPVEVTGRYYGLVQFIASMADGHQFRVRHFNRSSRTFDGPEEVISLPPVSKLTAYGSYPSTTQGLETSPYNDQGWYIYGALDRSYTFVVQSLCPRALLQLQPNQVIGGGPDRAYGYIRHDAWARTPAQKGTVASVLCPGSAQGHPDATTAVGAWQLGDRALVLHNYGGIGGHHKEPAAFSPLFFGHFAYGRADVIHDPLADELRFDLRYYQVYAHNVDGLVAGTLHWCRYQGDRQRGWLGTRPTCDILIKLAAFSRTYDFDGVAFSPLCHMEAHLQAMTARYRIGNGTGGTFVGPTNNCAQDSNQALFASIQHLGQGFHDNAAELRAWETRHPQQAGPFRSVLALGQDLKQTLHPFGMPRPRGETNEFDQDHALQNYPLRHLLMGLGSWRTVLPRKASDVVVRQFLTYGAAAWVLRTSQVGGYDPNIEPIAPLTF